MAILEAIHANHPNQYYVSPHTAPRCWLFGDLNQAESRVVARRGPVPQLDTWYKEGVDVHSLVCQRIARVVQESRLPMPHNKDQGADLFYKVPWNEFKKGYEEREIAKRIVHGSNYGMGLSKLALILGVSEQIAAVLSKIYFVLFPEVKSNYQAWIENELRTKKRIETPEPVRFVRVFHGIPPASSGQAMDEEDKRQAYAAYPQCIVAALVNQAIGRCSRIFLEDVNEALRDQWHAWYGAENWDTWRSLRDRGVRNPRAILWSGMDIRLNVHDAGGISVPDDPDLIAWTALTWKQNVEIPVMIDPNDPLVIPVEFKKGRTWGNDDLKDYKLAA